MATKKRQRPAANVDIDLPNGYSVRENRLFQGDLDLMPMAEKYLDQAGLDDAPLTIRFMQRVRDNFRRAEAAFAAATRETGFPGTVELAFASKANPNRSMIHTVIGSGGDYECSSRGDITIIRYAIQQGWLTQKQLIIANGFKTPSYADALIELAKEDHMQVIPVFDSAEEAAYFAQAGVKLNVGVRYRVPGRGDRFGMEKGELLEAARIVSESPNLKLILFHAIQQYPAINNPEHLEHLRTALSVFMELRQTHPSLQYFDIGGGLPVELEEPDDLQEWCTSVQRMVMEVCGKKNPPSLVIESGRYLAGTHQMYVFRVARVKSVDGVAQYVLSGGIMSNMPDVWALGITFPVAPLNHWDSPFQKVRLAGLTCDHDDVYPHEPDQTVLLPTRTDGLLVGFLDVGAYQDILGGEGGAKHCLLSEGATIIVGENIHRPDEVIYRPPEAPHTVLSHLGYRF